MKAETSSLSYVSDLFLNHMNVDVSHHRWGPPASPDPPAWFGWRCVSLSGEKDNNYKIKFVLSGYINLDVSVCHSRKWYQMNGHVLKVIPISTLSYLISIVITRPSRWLPPTAPISFSTTALVGSPAVVVEGLASPSAVVSLCAACPAAWSPAGGAPSPPPSHRHTDILLADSVRGCSCIACRQGSAGLVCWYGLPVTKQFIPCSFKSEVWQQLEITVTYQKRNLNWAFIFKNICCKRRNDFLSNQHLNPNPDNIFSENKC